MSVVIVVAMMRIMVSRKEVREYRVSVSVLIVMMRIMMTRKDVREYRVSVSVFVVVVIHWCYGLN
jgi:hypothetical protein